LELKYKGKGTELIPTDVQAQALYEQAASIEAFNFDPYASGIVFEKIFKKYIVKKNFLCNFMHNRFCCCPTQAQRFR
jgi:hypothetical protein